MADEKNPVWKPKDMDENKPVMMEFTQMEPTAEGDGQYGHWELYPVVVTAANVTDSNKQLIPNYSGEAIFFGGSSKISTKIVKYLKTGVMSFLVDMHPTKNKKGSYYPLYVLKTADGEELA